MLELKHLRTLLTLAETGSVSRAAEQLHLTQSALSHQLRQLEAQLGTLLFVRKSTPLCFTPAGQILLNAARDILPRLTQAEAALKGLLSGEQGRLFVGVECHTCFEWLLPVVRRFQKAWPGVDLDILPSFSASALTLLQEHKCDLVITSDPIPHPRHIFEKLFQYEQVLIVPPGHRLASQPFITPDALTEETLICYPVEESRLDIFRRFLHPAGRRPRALRFSELTLMMLQLVDSGRGVCVLPRWLLDTQPEFDHLCRIRLGEEGLWSSLYAATDQAQHTLPHVQDFIDQIRQVGERF